MNNPKAILSKYFELDVLKYLSETNVFDHNIFNLCLNKTVQST